LAPFFYGGKYEYTSSINKTAFLEGKMLITKLKIREKKWIFYISLGKRLFLTEKVSF